MLKKIIPFACLTLTASFLFAQELGLNTMRDVWEINKTNPALFPEGKAVVALPSPYYNYDNNVGTFNDFFVDQGNGNYTFELGALFQKAAFENSLKAEIDLNTLAFQYRINKLVLGIHHYARIQSQLDFPKTLAGLAAKGNAQYIGEEVEFAPEVNLLSYNALGLSAAYEISDFLTIGARFKMLGGIADITTDHANATIHTDDDIYEVTIKTDALYRSSGFISYDSLFRLDESEAFKFGFSTQNKGFAFDLGLELRPSDRLTIALSLLDVGVIEWDKNPKAFRTNIDRKFEATEIDLTSIWEDGDVQFEPENEDLSFNEVFKFNETEEVYRTILPKKLYTSASWQLDDKFSINAVYFGDIANNKLSSAVAIGGQGDVLKFLTVGANYAIRNQKNNLGLSLLFKFGPVRFYAISDNVISVFKPYNTKDNNLRLGLNLVFKGKEKEQLPVE